jgi:hypothetical protein
MRRRVAPLLARAQRTVKPLADLWQIQPRGKLESKKEKKDLEDALPRIKQEVQ